MSKVALRVYNRDIEALIDQGHLDEAIAHCKHVLKTFPKYLEMYRLLGKAYLEAHRFSDAADIFQRVLLAVPDDFIAHLGMSIVSDEQKDLDRAIWHMERAYEVSPSNTGVQNELRRLYGRRDGLEPPKIRLTRGALAQMYTKGGQYQQAVVEIKSVLAEDSARNDMKVLLARAYFRAGMKVEATEICTELLRQYPYNLDANRILVEILPGTSLAGSVEQYRKRVQALDPYASLVTGSLFDVDSVPDSAVSVDRLEYDAALQDTDWQTAAQPSAAPEIQPSTDNLPDWMRQAGWGPSTGEFQEGPVNFDEPETASDETPAAGLVEAELPDWLKAMAPPSVRDSEPAAEENLVAEDLDWLAGLGGPLADIASAAPPAPPAESQPALPADVPDWLSGLGESQPPAPPAESQPALAADVPDWLSGLGESQPPAPPVQEPPARPEPVADWLKDLTPPTDQQPLSAPVSGPGTSESEQDEALKWLESLAARQGARPEELLTKPEERQEELPDWVAKVEEEPAAELPAAPPAAEPALPAMAEESAAEALSAPVSGPGTSESEQDEALKWLESLAARQGARPEELLTKPEERQEELPDWVAKVEEEPAAELPAAPPAAELALPAMAEESAAEALSAPLSGPGTSESEQDEALKWLESLAARQGARPEELLTKPEERQEELPDWLTEVEKESVEQTPAEALPWEAQAEPAAEISSEEKEATFAVDDWLASLEQPSQEASTPMPWETPAATAPAESFAVETPAEPLPWETPAEPPAAAVPAESFPWESAAEETPAEPLPWETPAEPPAAAVPAESFPWESAAEETPAEPLPWETPAEPPAAAAPAESFAVETPAAGAQTAGDVSAWLESLDEQRPAPATAETEELPDWLKDVSVDEEAPALTSIPGWTPVEEPPASQQTALETAAQTEAVIEAETAPQPPLRLRSTESLQDKDASFIRTARELLDKGRLDEAMNSYTKLIKKGKLLEEVIEDLNEIVYRHPVDVIVWQTMGDAYMRSNRLQEALDAYTKAEELLRR